MPLTGASSLCSRSGLGCSLLLCLGLQNPALCRWSSRSSGSDRSPLAVGVQLGKTSPSPGLDAAPPWRLPLAVLLWWRWLGEVWSNSDTLLFCCCDHRNCFQGICFKELFSSVFRVISWNLCMRPLQFPCTLSLPFLAPCSCSCLSSQSCFSHVVCSDNKS